MKKRLLCFILAFAMCLGLVPINSVSAKEEVKKLNVIPLDDGSYMIELPVSSSERQLRTKGSIRPMGVPTTPNTITPETNPDQFEDQWVKVDIANLFTETLGIKEVTLRVVGKAINYSRDYVVKVNGNTSIGEYKIGEDFKAPVPIQKNRPAIFVIFPDGRDSRAVVEAKSEPTGFAVNIDFLGHSGVRTEWYGVSNKPNVKAKYLYPGNGVVSFDLPTVTQNSILRKADIWEWKDHDNPVYLELLDDALLLCNDIDTATQYFKVKIDDKEEGQLGTSNYYFKVTGSGLVGFTVTSREKVSVDFEAGKGTWKAPATKPATQYTGHSLTVNDSFTTNPKLGPIIVPNEATDLTPPAKAAGQTTDNKFIGWSATGENGPAVDLATYEINGNTTFTALYGPKAQGKVNVKYVDENNAEITDTKYHIDGQNYSNERPGNIGETVGTDVASTAAAPKFLGYKVTGVEVKPAAGQTTATYTDPATATVTYKYEKLPDIIPDKTDNGTNNPDATPDVKATYKKVTIKVDSAKGQFKKGVATRTENEFVYYVNPVEGKSLQDVLTASGLTPESKDANVYKIDTAKPWKFDPTQTEATPTVPAADFALTTVVGKDNVKDTGVVMEVNFKQTKADQLKDKLEPVPIKVWVGDPITWSKGVELNDANKNNQDLKDLLAAATVTDLGVGGTLAQPATARTSGTQNLPDGVMGNLKVAFDDGSALAVNDQTLYVSPIKVPVNPNNPIDPGKLPDDKLAVEFKLGEGVKIGTKGGNATTPVLYETFYVKPNESLEDSDIPETELQDGYKDNKWYNGNAVLAQADYTRITKAKEFIAKAVQKGNGTAVLKFVDNEGNALEPATNTKLQITGETYNPSISGKDGTDISYDKSKAPKILGYVFTNENAVINPAKFVEGQVATITLKYKKLADTYKGKDDGNGNDTPDVPGNDPDKDNIIDIIKKTYVKVKFLADEATRTSDEDADKDKDTYRRGKLNTNENEVFYYINPKAKDTLGDFITQQGIVVPTINPKNEYKEASPKWNPDLDQAKTKAVSENPKELIFTAQYEEKGKSNVMFSFKFFKKEAGSSTEESVADNKLGNFIKPVLTNSNQLVGSPITFNSYTDQTINVGDLQGTWHFEGWYKESDTSFTTKVTSATVSETADDNKFVGKWVLTEKRKADIIYEFDIEVGVVPAGYDETNAPFNKNKNTLTQNYVKKAYIESTVNAPGKINTTYDEIINTVVGGKNVTIRGTWTFVKWTPTNLKVNVDGNVFTGTWNFEEKLVRPTDPKNPDTDPDTEVLVIFKKGEHGTLSGIALDSSGNEVNVSRRDELAYCVKKKATWKDMKDYIPKAVADSGWSVANPSWKPVLPEKNEPVVEGTYTAQYVERPTDITLTLDENYRDGKITDYDVEEDELIRQYLYTPHRRGYVFEGWSYRRDYLDEVRPGDRIYEPTVLYAIWTKDRAAKDKHEEPKDTRKVYEHSAYIFGYPDGSVRPNGNITRAEAAAMLARLLNLEALASDAKPMFPDTPSSWYNKAINAVVARGIMKGYPDGRFRPNAPITRAEFTTMIAAIDNKAYGVAPFADVKGHWAELAIGREYQAGRINGYPDGTFRPNAPITRAEVATILNKVFDRCYDAMSLLGTKNKEYVRLFTDLYQNFWAYYDIVEATNNHSFKLRNEFKGIQEDWVEIK